MAVAMLQDRLVCGDEDLVSQLLSNESLLLKQHDEISDIRVHILQSTKMIAGSLKQTVTRPVEIHCVGT